MTTSRRLLLFASLATGLLAAMPCRTAVAPRMPQNIWLVNATNHGDLIFIFYANGNIEKGFVLDPKTANPMGSIQLPAGGPEEEKVSDGKRLPRGHLSILAVPRALMEKNKNVPDQKWLVKPPAGVVQVAGVIHHYPMEKSA